LTLLAPLAERYGVTLNLEPLNTTVDHAGYWLDSSQAGFELVRRVGSPNLRLLFDIYHMQVMEGNLIARMRAHLDLIGHIHVADVPGRHQPGTGEINYRNIFCALRDAGYDRAVGMEFAPLGPSDRAASDALALLKG
jgi:hydroxypyruvate isomerase